MTTTGRSLVTAERLVAVVCLAQVFVQIGASFWPALLPGMVQLWGLSWSEAGWITAIFFGAYMIAVPVLVTATDRFDPRQVYLLGVGLTVIGHMLFGLFAEGFWSALGARALTGIGWAGTYMTGLKLLADQVDAKLMSRATAGHAASVGISGALSFACADLLSGLLGWRGAFVAAACSAAIAWLLVVLVVPRRAKDHPVASSGIAMFDFRPVFRNRSAMAYAIGYCIHTLEYHALRGWGVALLGFVAASTGAGSTVLSPAIILTTLGILATFATVSGNEAAIFFGRRRFIAATMVVSAVCAGMLGLFGTHSYLIGVILVLAYGLVISLDSSSLTAGTAGSAEPSRRGATLAVHSTLGYAGGFVGPLIVGWALDYSGGMSPRAWALAYLLVAAAAVAGMIVFQVMRPGDLVGDRKPSA
jgi:predicted MFS family arabinose efflux permease